MVLSSSSPVADVSLTTSTRQWTIVMRTRKGGGAARSFCRAFAYSSQAVSGSCRSIASQNVVSTCPGPGTNRGNGVGEGEGEGVGCGEEPLRGEAVADADFVTVDPTVEAVLAPWNHTTPSLSRRKSEKQTSPVMRVQSH